MGIDVPTPEDVISQVQSELANLGNKQATDAEILDILRSERESSWLQLGNGVSIRPGTEPRLVRVEFRVTIDPYKDGQRPAIAGQIRRLSETIQSAIQQHARVNFAFDQTNVDEEGPFTTVTVPAQGIVEIEMLASEG